jgi:hypothetical protein
MGEAMMDELVASALTDPMGVQNYGGDIWWLPRSLYPARAKAQQFIAAEWGLAWTEMRIRARYMRPDPENEEQTMYENDDYYVECEKDEPGAVAVWRCEDA